MVKLGQLNILNFLIGIAIFVIIWGIFLGKFISEWCQDAIITYGYTGLTAFMLAYTNLWIFFILLITIALFYYMSGGSQ